MEYSSEALYITSSTTLKERIAKCEQIETALLDQMLLASANVDTSSYTLNDGQTIITQVNRSPQQIEEAINGIVAYKNMLIQKLNKTNVVRLIDANNFFRR